MSDDEEFLDFSVATPLEKFVARLSHAIPTLLLQEKSSYLVIEQSLPFRRDSYILSYIRGLGHCAPLLDRSTKFQDWFQVESHLTLSPDSYSGRILDPEEASTLLSAGAIATANTHVDLPLFIPTHDALRDCAAGVGPAGSRHYESDSLHTTDLPTALFYPGEQLQLFAARLEARDAEAAAACRAAADAGRRDGPDAPPPDGARVTLQARTSFPLASPRLPAASREGAGSAGPDPLTPCHHPVSLDLDLVWRYDDAGEAVRSATGQFDPDTAVEWYLVALDAASERDDGHRGFALQAADKRRRYLRLLGGQEGAGSAAHTPLSAALAHLAGEGRWAAQAPSMGHLASTDWWLQLGIQPEAEPGQEQMQALLGQVLRSLAPASKARRTGRKVAPYVGKAAPPDSILGRFALAALRMQSVRSVAALWNALLRALRFEHLDAGVALPAGAGGQAGIDHGSALLHQHLQLLDICVTALASQQAAEGGAVHGAGNGTAAATAAQGADDPKERPATARVAPSGSSSEASSSSSSRFHSAGEDDVIADAESAGPVPRRSTSAGESEALGAAGPATNGEGTGLDGAAAGKRTRPSAPAPSPVAEGVATFLPGVFLLNHPEVPLAVPETQAAAPCTEDVLLGAGGGQEGRAAHAALLASDMSAFKAANPAGACLADFLRWHSPADCGQDGTLSCRMAEPGNAWAAAWAAAPPLASARQRTLLQPRREAERALHVLENVEPATLWAQILQVARGVALDLLESGEASALPPVAQLLQELRSEMGVAEEDSFPSEQFRRAETVASTAASMLATLRRLHAGAEDMAADPADGAGCDGTARGLVSDVLSAGLGRVRGPPAKGGGEARAEVEGAAGRAYLARCMAGGIGGSPSTWPAAHRTEWLLGVVREGRGLHHLHLESLAAELRVSTVISSTPARAG